MREKSLLSGTTTTLYGNRKFWVKLNIFLKLEPWDTFLPNITIAAIFIKVFWLGDAVFWSWLWKIRKDLQGGILLPDIYLYSSFLMKLNPCPILLLIYSAMNSSVPGTEFSFFKKEFTWSVFSVCSFKESRDFGKDRNNNTLEKQSERSQGRFCCFFPCYKNWWEKPCISHVVKYTIWWESDGRKVPTRWGKDGYHFPRLSQSDGFPCIFPYYGKLMGKPMYYIL